MAKFIGPSGLTYLWSKIKKYVGDVITNLNLDSTYQKQEAGKGLSTNDYTTAEKNKLSGIAAGAEVNVQSNWAETDSSDDSYIKNKPSIPSKVSELTNDTGFITLAEVPEGVSPTTSAPLMDGTASVGSEVAYARGDHRHPTDTSRQAVITGGASTITATNLTASRALVSNTSGKVAVSDVTSTELSYLDGVTSAIQTQLDSKATNATAVTDVAYDATNKKITKTINGTKTDVVSVASIKTDLALTKSDVGLGNVENKSSATIRSEITSSNVTTALGFTPADSAQLGVANGIAQLDNTGKVPASQLPSYVDDVIEAYVRSGQTALSSTWLAENSATGTVITPQAGVIYVLMNGSGDTYPINSQYRWGGTSYVKLNDGGVSEMTNAEMDTATNNWA